MIVVGTQDVGPAKYLAALFYNYSADKVSYIASMLSDQLLSAIGDNIDICDINKIPNLKLIITGTCSGYGIDKKLIEAGRAMKIPTVAIIEHWTLYHNRFRLNDTTLLPDYIFVNDRYALNGAILDGLPKKLLYAHGNPYLEKLGQKRLYPVDKTKFKEKLGFSHNQIMTFISEELSFPKKSEGYRGFTEFEVLGDIISVVAGKGIDLIIKLHPEEMEGKYDDYESLGGIVVAKDSLDFDSVVAHSDYIVGMDSMLLIEASLFRNDVLCYRPNAINSFIGSDLGTVCELKSKEELKRVLKTKKNNYNKKFNFSGSKKNILNHIGKIIA